MSSPIEDYALLSDCQGSALVGCDGSIDWACLPRFDSPAVFARLLGDGAGHWRIAPAEPARVTRAYLADTMVLRTESRTSSGAVAVTDAMVFGPDERGHRIGRASPHIIVRRLEGIAGTVDVSVELSPRAGYGLTEPVLVCETGGLRSLGGPLSYVISSETFLDVRDSDATARLRIEAGDVVHFALLVASPWETPVAFFSDTEMAALLEATNRRLAVVVGPAPDLRGAVRRDGPPQRPGLTGADLRPDRGNCRRAHHVAARDGRRLP